MVQALGSSRGLFLWRCGLDLLTAAAVGGQPSFTLAQTLTLVGQGRGP
jgi:hypothetical protein